MSLCVCEICGQNLKTSDGCSVGRLYIDGRMYKRIPVYASMKNGRCVDCNAVNDLLSCRQTALIGCL